jgi:Na+/H+-dicarboxylate symporter
MQVLMEEVNQTKALKKYFTLNNLMLLSVGVGITTGWLNLQAFDITAKVVSEIIFSALKLLSVPIIFLSIVSTIAGMRSIEETKKLGFKVVKYTLLTTLLAAATGLALFLLINPVQGQAVNQAAQLQATNGPSYLTALLQMFPSNIVKTFAENNVIGVVLIAVFFGISILTLPEDNKKTLHHFFSSLFAALLKMTQFLIQLMPIGVWAFMHMFVKDLLHGSNFNLNSLFLYLVCVNSATLLQAIVVLPVILKLKGLSPLRIFKGMFSALSVAFFSKSSSATLPVAMKCCSENLHISHRVSSFSLPLCTTINMNGCATFIITTVLFVSMSNGVVYTGLDLFLWIFIATIAAIGNAGIPMGCFFLSSAFLAAMDVPLNIMGLILPIYTLMDMLETAVNVWSDGCVTALVEQEVTQSEVVEKCNA